MSDPTHPALAGPISAEHLRHLAEVLEHVSDAVISTDLEYRIQSWNRGAEDTYGWTAHEALGRTTQELLLTELLPEDAEQARRALLEAGEWRGEVGQYHKAGHRLHVLSTVRLRRDAGGSPVGAVALNRDITERRRAEAELALAAERARLAEEVVRGYVYDVRWPGPVVSRSAGLQSLLGYAPEEIRPDRDWWADLIHPDDRERVMRSDLMSLEGAVEARSTEYRLRRRDGSYVWVWDQGRLIRDGEGRPQRLVGNTLDITERKRAEEALRRGEVFVRGVLDSLPAHVAVLDAGGKVVAVNRPWENYAAAGGSSEVRAGVGADYLAVCRRSAEAGDPHAARALAGLEAVLEGRLERFGVEYPCPAPGREQWFAMYVTRAPQGGLVVSHLEVTERRQAEEEQRSSAELLRTVMEATPDLVWAKDAEGRITLGNRATFELLGGGDPAKVLGRGAELIPHPPHARQVEENDARIIAAGQSELVEEEFGDPASPLVFQTVKAPLRDGEGRVVGVVGVSRDVTAARRHLADQAFLAELRDALASLERAEQIAREVGARTVRHLGLSRCLFVEVDEAASTATVFHDSREAPASLVGEYRLDDFHTPEERRRLAGGEPLVIPDVRSGGRPEEAAANFEALGIRSLVNAPYASGGRWRFALSSQHDRPYPWREHEVGLLMEVAALVYPRLERARAEARLKESEGRLRMALESGRMGAWDWDMASGVQHWSSEMSGLFGLPHLPVRSINDFFERVHHDDLPQIKARADRADRAGQEYVGDEFRIVLPGGEERWVSSRARFHRDAAGRVTRMTGVNLDVTEQKRAEEELVRATAQLEATMANLPAGLALLDRDLRFVRINAHLAAINGLPAAEHLGRTPSEIALAQGIPAEPAAAIEATLRRVLDTGEGVYGLEVSGPALDDPRRVRHTLASWFPVKVDGQTALVGASVIDITERRRRELEAALLAEVAEAAARQTDPAGVIRAAAMPLERHFGASRVIFTEVDAAAGRAAVLHEWHSDGLDSLEGIYPLHEYIGPEALGRLTAGQTSALPDRRHHPAPGGAERLERLGVGAVAHTPYLGGGRLRFLLVVALPAPHVWAEGELALLRDLAERVWSRVEAKRAELALQESEARFRALADGLPLLVWVHDAEGHQEFVNQTFCEYFGVTLEQTRGEGWRMLTHPDDTAAYAGEFMDCVRERRPFHAEVRVKRGGEWRWLESWGRPRITESGEYLGYVGTSADITERKQAEEVVRASEERLRLATDVAGMFAWEMDVDSGRVVWSHNAARLLGVAEEELPRDAGDSSFFVHEADRGRVLEAYAKAVEAGQDIHAVEFRGADGRAWALHGLLQRGPEGRLRRAVGVTQDITGRKQAEERYRQLAESQKRFVNDAAHELRAPLTAIQGNLELLTRFRGMRKADREEALAEVSREAQRLGRLVNDMLALARGDTGAGLRLQALDLAALLRSACADVGPLATAHDLRATLPERLWLRGDPDRLKQLALQLLENALKYTPSGGQIRLALEADAEGGWAEFQVADTGVGISPEDLPLVFERFFRVDPARRRGPDPGGTGLGLSIAKSIVQIHGGEIRLESQPGRGTTAVVRLPLLQP